MAKKGQNFGFSDDFVQGKSFKSGFTFNQPKKKRKSKGKKKR